MMPTRSARNELLAGFARSSPASFEEFFDQLQPVSLARGTVIGAARARAEFVYFLESGVVSLVASTSNGQTIEVAIVGPEGVAGIADALGQHPLPYEWVVQMRAEAFKVPTRVVRQHILSCGDLHELLMAYSQHVMHQLTQSAVCNRFHTAVQRLSRWLLLTADRAGTNQLELTHEYMAQMVGAPRSAVSHAASLLRAEGVIDYRRGLLTIRDERLLRQHACDCVDAVKRRDFTTPILQGT